jgi:hypothetical protein
MLPPLPWFDPQSVGARFGSYYNQIRRRLLKQTLKSSPTVMITETDRGQVIDRIGVGGTTSPLSLGFAVTHTGSDVEVAAGKVLSQAWSGATGADFRPSNWVVESNYAGTTLSGAATAVWLQVQFTESDTTSEGNLGTEVLDISGGAGGRGGGGGGGGASNGTVATEYPTFGIIGDDGIDGGAGGAGGVVRLIADDSLVATTGGYGADGGDGGAGGAGGDGTSATFTRKTKGVVTVRHYTLSSISAHTSKGTPSPTSLWVKLATITGTDVVQHHIGPLRLTPAVLTFVVP